MAGSTSRAWQSRLLVWGKWLWLALVLFFAFLYLGRKGGEVWLALGRMSWQQVLLAVLSLVAAKVLLVYALQISVRQVGFNLPRLGAFSVYNYSQLAKYTPGSIWQFVSKAAWYALRGLKPDQIRDAIVLETVSEPAGACLVAVLFAAGWLPLISRQLPVAAGSAGLAVLAGAAGLLVWWVLGKRDRAQRWISGLPRFALAMLPVQLGIWLILGAGFHALRVGFDPAPLTHSLGLFGLAYILGFIVPVAPAGLGIRESVLVLGMNLPPAQAWAIAGAHRVLFLLVEIALAALAWGLEAARSRREKQRADQCQ
ncbi:MAG: hypothetical protein AB1439_08285 [candidate division FCPU426 bacterium]